MQFQKISILPPQEGNGIFLRGRGFCEAKAFKEMYKGVGGGGEGKDA